MNAGRINLAHTIRSTRRVRRSEWKEQFRICLFILVFTTAATAIISALDRWLNG